MTAGHRTLAVLILACWLPSATFAQSICDVDDTRDSCLQDVENWVNAQAEEAEKVAAEADATVAVKNTGEGAIGDVGNATSTNDYLPLLRALVDSGGLDGEGDQGIGFEWSNPLGLPAEHQNKLSVALAASNVYKPLKDALREASLGDSIGALEEDIDSGDDVVIAFSYSPASERRGRDPHLHQTLFSALLGAADSTEDEATAASRAAENHRADLETQLGLSPRFAGPFNSIGARAGEYVAAVEAEHLSEFGSMAALSGRLRENGFYGLLDLVNNQPQLNVALNYRSRSDVVGPDEFRATLSYELGWYNVNTFRNFAKRSCGGEKEVACLAGYLAREDVQAGLASSPRVSFSAEYLERSDLSFELPGTTFTYAEESNKAFRLNAIWARYLGSENEDRARARVDVALSYEDVSDDPSRQDRGLASATLSYPVARGFYLAIGMVYATKPEFRGDVDEEINARAGLTYKVLEAKK